MFTNARSILNKLTELENLIRISNPLFLCISETWLSSSVPNTALNLTNYRVYSKDRKCKGGGVLIAVRNSVPVEEIESLQITEIIAVNIKLKESIRVISCYIPNSSDTAYLKQFF